jgi:hypothetical protein
VYYSETLLFSFNSTPLPQTLPTNMLLHLQIKLCGAFVSALKICKVTSLNLDLEAAILIEIPPIKVFSE